MANKRVTMQDIADACGLSRNTVSKVFNGRGAVPQATRAIILKKAEELGYGAPVESALQSVSQPGGSIALLTNRLPKDAHFGTFFVTTFTDQISRAGYTLKIFEISEEELMQKKLPPHFISEQTAGIVGIELFDAGYLSMICELNIPTIFIDSPPHASTSVMNCDFVSMENLAAVFDMVGRLARLGAKRIGFVGDIDHCGSFYERWIGFCMSLSQWGLAQDDTICILAPDDSPYHDPEWLLQQIQRMDPLPDAFVCANDYLAIHLMAALKKKGLVIPDDVMITGFDGTSQSALVEPPLTTAQIPGVEIGRIAADILLARIANPAMPYTWTRVKSTPVWRASIRRQ